MPRSESILPTHEFDVPLKNPELSSLSHVAFVFPGQGGQKVGMGAEIAIYPEAQRIFRLANTVVGYDLERLCLNGPQAELDKTDKTQPAITTTNLAYLEVFRHRLGISPQIVAGHSLGEISALAAAGVLNYEDAIRLSQERGSLMAQSSDQDGGMGVILGTQAEDVWAIIRDFGPTDVRIANKNTPIQNVISGKIGDVHAILEEAKRRGAQKAEQLSISIASHHPEYMAAAKFGLEKFLDKLHFNRPEIPIVFNSTSAIVRPEEFDENTIKEYIAGQLTQQVDWISVARAMQDFGAKIYVEVGSGRVLSGLLKRVGLHIPNESVFSSSAFFGSEKKLGEQRNNNS